MHTIRLISKCLSEEDSPSPKKVKKEICAVTGYYTDCIKRRELLKKGFTNESLLRAPLSEWVSVEAYRVLRYRPERSRSWICDGRSFKILDRLSVRDVVINQKYSKIWAGYATTSFKKHGSLWARVNRLGNRVWRFEALDVDCSDHDLLEHIWNRLNVAFLNGIGRKSMETLLCPPVVLKMIGLKKWITFEKWARPLIGSPLYRFMVYLLPSQKELNEQKTRMENTFEDIDFFEAVG
jgi:hypothetical protein